MILKYQTAHFESMVEIFRTNINTKAEAKFLLKALQTIFPFTDINFDLEDCDRILRMEGDGLMPEKISAFVKKNNYECEILY